MTVVSVEKDTTALTLAYVAEFDADVERVWQVWADPRQLERWWGPPTYPATFHVYDFVVGAQARYYMTGPEGQKAHGWWEITLIDAPHRFEFDDGFGDENGEPDLSIGPGHAVVTLEPLNGGTRMTTTSYFTSQEQLQQMLEMGMEEGMLQAMGQIDALLLEPATR